KEAAPQFLRELLWQTGICRSNVAFHDFRKFLTHESSDPCALNLEAIFDFVVYGKHLLVIPKERFAGRDLLLVYGYEDTNHRSLALVEFLENRFRIEPRITFSSYIRRCLKRRR